MIQITCGGDFQPAVGGCAHHLNCVSVAIRIQDGGLDGQRGVFSHDEQLRNELRHVVHGRYFDRDRSWIAGQSVGFHNHKLEAVSAKPIRIGLVTPTRGIGNHRAVGRVAGNNERKGSTFDVREITPYPGPTIFLNGERLWEDNRLVVDRNEVDEDYSVTISSIVPIGDLVADEAASVRVLKWSKD